MNRKKLKVIVCAKVNLSLNILGASSGMHALDSVMASVDLTDAITICERLDSHVCVEFDAPFSVPKTNSVTRAIDVLRDEIGDFGIDVFVKKNMPLSGGLGGSSADAAAAIIAIDKMFQLQLSSLRMRAMAFKVSSDVPFMLEGGFARVLKAGEQLQKVCAAPDIFMVIAKPDLGVDTAKCYAEFDKQNAGKTLALCDNNALVSALQNGDILTAKNMFSNALQASAIALLPAIQNVLNSVKSVGASHVVMSGSGSSVVGYFDDFASAKAAEIKLQKMGLWAIATKTMPCGIIIE